MSWKHICRVLMVLGVGIWLSWPVRADESTPPWQQPPGLGGTYGQAARFGAVSDADVSGQCETCGSGGECSSCGDACGEGELGFDPFCGLCLPHDDWVRLDALLWWTKGAGVPALLTTSPDGTSQANAGVLGKSTTSVLLGNQELNNGFRPGGRIAFGTWLDTNDNFGIEFTYLGLGQSSQQLTWTSTGSPILARPYFNAKSGVEASHLIAYPSVYQGSFSCLSTNEFHVGEVVTRWGIARAPGYRIELLAGYRYQRLLDNLSISDTAATASPGSTIQILDQFQTQNDFNGGEVGIATEWHQCRWSFETNLKLAVGNNRSRTAINGSTTTGARTLTGGLLALPSNIGVYDADQLSVIPELGVTCGYDLTCHLRATVGYSFIYWSNVARPGDQIDLNVDPSQFPGQGQTTGYRPTFVQHNTDFWAQGINVGLDYRF